MDWSKYSFVLRGKYRKSVLSLLSVERTPSQISGISKINASHVSRALSELKDIELVKCINDEQKNGRIYKLTKDGTFFREKLIESEKAEN